MNGENEPSNDHPTLAPARRRRAGVWAGMGVFLVIALILAWVQLRPKVVKRVVAGQRLDRFAYPRHAELVV